jgi:hypothetical protein
MKKMIINQILVKQVLLFIMDFRIFDFLNQKSLATTQIKGVFFMKKLLLAALSVSVLAGYVDASSSPEELYKRARGIKKQDIQSYVDIDPTNKGLSSTLKGFTDNSGDKATFDSMIDEYNGTFPRAAGASYGNQAWVIDKTKSTIAPQFDEDALKALYYRFEKMKSDDITATNPETDISAAWTAFKAANGMSSGTDAEKIAAFTFTKAARFIMARKFAS